MRFYIDTSAFVKRYSKERGSEAINRVFESEHELATSHWTLAETVAAIDKKVAKKQITKDERDLAISVVFSDILDKNIIFTKLADEFLYPVTEKILEHHLSADDALQLFSCMVSLSPILLAADKALLKAAKKEGIDVIDMEKEDDIERLEEILEDRH